MAHRGASDHAPENSLAAFRLALEHGADLLETDIWLSSDGELMCHHDPTLQRMTGDKRRLDCSSRAQIERLRLHDFTGRYADERIPTLEALVASTPIERPLMLELKDPRLASPRAIARLADVLRERIAAQTVGVLAFDLKLVERVRAACPGLIGGHIAVRHPWPNQPTELVGPYWPLLRLNPWYVRAAHKAGKRVCPLDPRLHDRLGYYLRLDVDALLTNDPLRTRASIDALRGSMAP